MKRKNKKFQKKNSNSLNKLSLFQKNDGKFSKKCPLSIKNAPIVDYKNINLLKKYISDNGKIISSKITSVSFSKQKIVNTENKLAGYLNSSNFLLVNQARIGVYLALKTIVKKTKKNEILLSPYTIADVINMVILAGGKPIFIDINIETFNINE